MAGDICRVPEIDSLLATLTLKSLMAKDFIGYQALTDQALRGVVRDALRRIEKSGLIGFLWRRRNLW